MKYYSDEVLSCIWDNGGQSSLFIGVDCSASGMIVFLSNIALHTCSAFLDEKREGNKINVHI